MSKDRISKDLSKLTLRPPVVVQILAIIGYTGFAIPVSIVAMTQFGILGLILVLFIVWGWADIANLGSKPSISDVVDRLRPETDAFADKKTGNASFDAYREEMLVRLEKERTNFEGFLDRLRDAKDKSQFDTFMADREKAVRDRRDLPATS